MVVFMNQNGQVINNSPPNISGRENNFIGKITIGNILSMELVQWSNLALWIQPCGE